MLIRAVALCLTGLFLSANAVADDWDWRVAPYLWTAGISGNTQIGSITSDVDASFGDILENLDFAAMIWIQAAKPGYSIYGNFVYMSIEGDSTSSPSGGTISTNLESSITEVGYFRKRSPNEQVGWELGLRYYSTEVSLTPTLMPGVSDRQQWVDGYVGYRLSRQLSDNWHFVGRITLGAGGSDFAYSLAPMFYRQYPSGNRLLLGLRTLGYDYKDSTGGGLPLVYDLRFTGLIVGYSFD